jgi:hypothetical protein
MWHALQPCWTNRIMPFLASGSSLPGAGTPPEEGALEVLEVLLDAVLLSVDLVSPEPDEVD